MDDREQMIRERAHEIWEQEGRPHGLEREHWLRAEQEIEELTGRANVSAAGLQGDGMLASPGPVSEPPSPAAESKRGTCARKRSAGTGEGNKAKKLTGSAAKTRK